MPRRQTPREMQTQMRGWVRKVRRRERASRAEERVREANAKNKKTQTACDVRSSSRQQGEGTVLRDGIWWCRTPARAQSRKRPSFFSSCRCRHLASSSALHLLQKLVLLPELRVLPLQLRQAVHHAHAVEESLPLAHLPLPQPRASYDRRGLCAVARVQKPSNVERQNRRARSERDKPRIDHGDKLLGFSAKRTNVHNTSIGFWTTHFHELRSCFKGHRGPVSASLQQNLHSHPNRSLFCQWSKHNNAMGWHASRRRRQDLGGRGGGGVLWQGTIVPPYMRRKGGGWLTGQLVAVEE